MDYKKAYEDALERAKGIYNENPSSSTAKFVCGQIFPELVESEDERIRKDIIDYLSNELHNVKQLTPRTNEFEAWIAYLERRKEQKPAEWSGEDEEILDAMIDMVSNSLYEPLCPREGMLAWLKAIHPAWKPSEEQMKALKVVARGFPADDPDAIDSLLTDLQKLI